MNPSPLRFTWLKRIALALALLGSAGLARAAILPQGSGIIYGGNHAFTLTAPKGWVLDNESGAQQGIHAVFYPIGSNWADSSVTMYAVGQTRGPGRQSAADEVKHTLDKFHANGSPNSQAKAANTLKTADGKDAPVYYFTGDQYGNFEAGAYILEPLTLQSIILSARDEKSFKSALPAFEALVASYRFMTDKVQITPPPKH